VGRAGSALSGVRRRVRSGGGRARATPAGVDRSGARPALGPGCPGARPPLAGFGRAALPAVSETAADVQDEALAGTGRRLRRILQRRRICPQRRRRRDALRAERAQPRDRARPGRGRRRRRRAAAVSGCLRGRIDPDGSARARGRRAGDPGRGRPRAASRRATPRRRAVPPGLPRLARRLPPLHRAGPPRRARAARLRGGGKRRSPSGRDRRLHGRSRSTSRCCCPGAARASTGWRGWRPRGSRSRSSTRTRGSSATRWPT
jgi:hypothetical protein